jgi:3-oxoacyl-[acyl-carrier protein] reductase
MFTVITGASRGIGKSLAYKFASSGYDLVLTCEKNISLLIDVKNDIEKKYNRKVIVKKGLLEEIDLPNDIYILINNAGKCDYNLFQDVTYEKYKEIMFANLDYTFLTTNLVSKKMLMWGILGASLESIYSMTKGAINALTKSLAKEFKESCVDVIAFALGAVDTDMNNHLNDDEKKDFVKELDNGRMWTPDEISEIIYDTISNKKYMSGDIILINNGLK